MSRQRSALLSTVGLKSVMALTGLALFLFVVVHMLGNLQIFAGQDKLNTYAESLRHLGPLLWAMRAGLLAIAVVHVATALALNARNQAARPVAYVSAKPQVTSYAARTMLMSGLVVLAFVVYHLLHFTFGAVQPAHSGLLDPKGRHDVYSMVVLGFRDAPTALAYVVAQALLCLHLSHGASSAFQSLGVTHPRLAFLKAGFGKAVAAVIFLGNVSIPLACLTGLVHLPDGVR
jgi:succinate dehydrogenase / fumarate reductase cytochrome b subunit